MSRAKHIDQYLALFTNPAHNIPEPYKEIATKIFARFEADNWGENNVEDVIEVAEATEVDPQHDQPQRRILPAVDDPIYGRGGVMDGIFRNTGKTCSYEIDKRFLRKSPKIFGHNGFEVGACWPLQVAALRDGCHGKLARIPSIPVRAWTDTSIQGARISGISGTITSGAYSIIISGAYESVDEDFGNTVFYSGPGSATVTNTETAVSNNGTRALSMSFKSQNDIRVLRSSGAKWDGSPRAGLRYDGLYKVKDITTAKNKKNGAYLRFRLERSPNQPPIRRDIPSINQEALFSRVQQGYTRTMPSK